MSFTHELIKEQAIILCVRPVILHMVKRRVNERQNGLEPQSFAPVLMRLFQTCLEAALKSLQILSALKDQGLLGMPLHNSCYRNWLMNLVQRCLDTSILMPRFQ